MIIFSYGLASLLELETVIQLGSVKAKIKFADESAAAIECYEKEAEALIQILGGSYKIARVLSRDLPEAISKVSLPTKAKFNWTVSGYKCPKDLLLQSREEVHTLLKQERLGKSKFLEPEITVESGEQLFTSEIKAGNVHDKILEGTKNPRGIDFVAHGGISSSKDPVFAQSISTYDIAGFELRDFGRPCQDPLRTLSPKIARVMVNLSFNAERGTLLDPFCGLGTVLQEALMRGWAVIGVDRSFDMVRKAKENIRWLKSQFRIPPTLEENFFAYDARRISRARMKAVDAIASEPILLPIYKENPKTLEAISMLERAQAVYARCMGEFSSILRKGSRIALMTPGLVDSSSKVRTFSLNEFSQDAGFKPYKGMLASDQISYPMRIKSEKRKIVHRNLNVFYLS